MRSTSENMIRKSPIYAFLLLFLCPNLLFAWPHPGEKVAPGVIYRRFSGNVDVPGSGSSLQQIFVTYIDTKNDAVSFVANQPGSQRITVSEFARRTKVHAAINANYFDSHYAPCGLMVGNGQTWTNAYNHIPEGKCSDSVGFDEQNQPSFFDSWNRLTKPPAGLKNVVTGMPTLIRDGELIDQQTLESEEYPPNLKRPNPRTAICLHEDEQTIVFVIVDGRQRGRSGMTGMTLARFLKHTIGCKNAIALDGGSSSTMFVRGKPNSRGNPPGIVNNPSNGNERPLCCFLGVKVVPTQSPSPQPDTAPASNTPPDTDPDQTSEAEQTSVPEAENESDQPQNQPSEPEETSGENEENALNSADRQAAGCSFAQRGSSNTFWKDLLAGFLF